MRLYEATGVGALLLTEAAPNLSDMFEPGVEIVTYTGADDLIEKARHYLEHEDERAAIARAGQARTCASTRTSAARASSCAWSRRPRRRSARRWSRCRRVEVVDGHVPHQAQPLHAVQT